MRRQLEVVGTVKTVCSYCGVGCGICLDVGVDDEGARHVVKAYGDTDHPANRGRLCTKGATTAEMLAAPGRLATALVRDERGDRPAPVDADEAIGLAATRLRAIIDEHGPDAVAMYVSGQMSIEAQYLANKLAKGFLGTNQIESNSRLCMASAGSGYKQSLGSDGPPGSYDDFDHADVFLVIGANMADCHPILFLRMMDRIRAGAKLIVVDPRRTATAEKADLFLQIRPGTDLALLNGLLHLLVADGAVDQQFIDEYTDGWPAMVDLVADYGPGRVAAITGLAQQDLRQAASWIGGAANWTSCWTMGLNQSTNGTWNTTALVNLHLATGAICRPGSGPFSLTGQPNAMGGREMGYMGPGLPGQRTVASAEDRAFVERLWQVPPGTLRSEVGGGTIDMFERMAEGRIKACWIICTNPVASVGNRRTVIAGLEKADLVITQDVFADTETNAYADIVLPASMWAEADGVMVNSERSLTLMRPALDAPGQAMADWQIIARMAAAMGYGAHFDYACAEEVFAELSRAANPATGWDVRGASYDRLRETPMQWPSPPGRGPARNPIRYLNDGASRPLVVRPDGTTPRLAFATDNGRAKFLARPHMPPAELPDDSYPFVLTTGRVQHQWHTLTKTGRVASLTRLEPSPFLEIHPADAESLGVAAGDLVEVSSRRGRAVLPARLTERVQQGLCFAPFHWNDAFGEYLAINAVTNDAVDATSFQPELKFCAVALTRVAAQHIPTPTATTEADAAADTETAIVAEPNAAVDAVARALGALLPAPALSESERHYVSGFLAAAAGAPAGYQITLPAGGPLDPLAAMWINGALAAARCVADGAGSPRPGAGGRQIIVLWASQTGTAQDFAEHAARRLGAAGTSVTTAPMADYVSRPLPRDTDVLLVTSTFGDGDPPDNGAGLLESLDVSTVPRGARFAVAAFGDSSYSDFCGFGRRLDERLEELGARRLVPRMECDGGDLQPADGWLDALGAALADPPGDNAGKLGPRLDSAMASAASSPAFAAGTLVGNRLLSQPGSAKEVREFIIDVFGAGLRYRPGDALIVRSINSDALVDEWVRTIGAEPTDRIRLPSGEQMPLADALRERLEIATPSPALLRFVGELSADRNLLRMLKGPGDIEIGKRLWGRQAVDIVAESGVRASAQQWVDLLRPLSHRRYSIASSPLVDAGTVTIVVSVVGFEAPSGARRYGVCSGQLARMDLGARVDVAIARSPRFQPPEDPSAAMIMIGPGTGVAPFLGFLAERRASGAAGRHWLLFGEQHESTDFYYRDDLLAMVQSGFLSRLDTAFSRDRRTKLYVQDRMIEHGRELWTWLEAGAYVYVCGDAKRMARDVDAALRSIIARHGAMSEDEADTLLKRLAATGRYVRDVY